MAPSSFCEVPPPVVEVAVTHAATTGDLVELLLADDELLRGEFEAIVTAGWGGNVPRWPTKRGGAWFPRGPVEGPGTDLGRGPRDLLAAHAVVAHQRGPPSPRRASGFDAC